MVLKNNLLSVAKELGYAGCYGSFDLQQENLLCREGGREGGREVAKERGREGEREGGRERGENINTPLKEKCDN